MTSQNSKIKQLLDQIDVLLDKTPPRLPWVMSGDVDQQRRILEETRDYLRAIEPQLAAREGYMAPPALTPYSAPAEATAGESAQQVLQAVLQEMNYLRSSVMQTLRSDIDSLQQQREALAQDVRFLEAQRQQYMVPQQQINQQLINDFLQSLMGRLQENLTEQVAQMMMNMQLEAGGDRRLPGEPTNTPLIDPTATHQGLLTPSQRLDHVQRVQAQSDQLLLKLDSTLKVIFESLHQNLQGYEESLGQGLDKMHRLGQQGEAMFAALVNRLAQQLGRDASAYLQSSLESSAWEAQPPFLPSDKPSARLETSEAVTEAQIDSLLNQLNRPTAFEQGGLESDLSVDLGRVELESEPPIFDLPDDDSQLTLFQTEPEDPIAAEPIEQPEQAAPLTEADASADLDAAFDLLNQFTTEAEAARHAEAEAEAIAPVETPESLYGEVDLYESMFGPASIEESAPQSALPETPAPELAEPEEIAIAPSLDEDRPYASDEAFPHEFEEALFDGVGDPAVQPELEATATEPDDEIPVAASYLFGESDAELEAEGWLEVQDSTLPTDPLSAPLSEPEFSEAPETINSLSDLIPADEEPDPAAITAPPLVEGDVAATLDESYEAAAPHEDLLETDQPIDSTPFDLTLSPNTLDQLSVDLSSLEGLERDDWELSDFAVTVPPTDGVTAPPVVEPTAPTLDSPTEEVLAEYFNGFDSAEDEFALPQPPRPDEVDLLFADTPDLSNLLEEPTIGPDELETLQADEDELELPAIDLSESELSDAEALRLLLDEESDVEEAESEQRYDFPPAAETDPEDDEDLLAALQLGSDDAAIPKVDAMLPAPTELEDADQVFSSVDAGIDALPNVYSPDDLPMVTTDGQDETASEPVDFDVEAFGAIASPSSPGLPLDMTGDTTLQDLFDTSIEDDDELEVDEQDPLEVDATEDNADVMTLGSFSDAVDEPNIASEANLDEYEVVGNSYASFSPEPPVAQDTLGDWFDAAPDEPDQPSEPSIEELFASENPTELFEVDALIEQVEQDDDTDAFTLEGLGSLFEDLPDYEPDVYPIPSPGDPKMSNGAILEGKFTEADALDHPETPEKKSP